MILSLALKFLMSLEMKTFFKPSEFKAAGLPLLLLLICCLACASGCRSAGAHSAGGFASVVISGNTPGQIRDAAVEVFARDGYIATQKDDPGNLVFEKEGSKMSNFAYGNWMGDTPIWMRVKAAIVPAGEMRSRLQCHAFLVRDRGSAAEEELPVSRLHRGQYQKLLEEVAQRFAKN